MNSRLMNIIKADLKIVATKLANLGFAQPIVFADLSL